MTVAQNYDGLQGEKHLSGLTLSTIESEVLIMYTCSRGPQKSLALFKMMEGAQDKNLHTRQS